MGRADDFRGNIEQKKPLSKKKLLMIVATVVLVCLAAFLVYWLVESRKPIVPDRQLMTQAVQAIEKNDNAALTSTTSSIVRIPRYDTSPEYLTLLAISAIRNEQPDQVSQYLQKLKALGNFTYVDYAPWKDKAGVIASIEHDLEQLQISKKGRQLKPSIGGGP